MMFSGFGFFESSLQVAQCLQAMGVVFADPAHGDLVQRRWVQVMELFASAPDDDHEVGRLQQAEVLGHRLPGHVEVRAEIAESQPVVLAKDIEQLTAAPVSEGFENCIHCENNMQPKGCMSSGESERPF